MSEWSTTFLIPLSTTSSTTATSTLSSSVSFAPDECVTDLPRWFDYASVAWSLHSTSLGWNFDSSYSTSWGDHTTITSQISDSAMAPAISDGGSDQYDGGNVYIVNNVPVTDWTGWDTWEGARPSPQTVGNVDVWQYFQWGEGILYEHSVKAFHHKYLQQFNFHYNPSIDSSTFQGAFDSRITNSSVSGNTTTTTSTGVTTVWDADLAGLFFGTNGAVLEDTSITIAGNLGADGGGEVVAFSYVYEAISGSSVYGFRKTVCGAGDGTIHHLWITSDPVAAHRFSLDTNSDFDRVSVHAGHFLAVVTYFDNPDEDCLDDNDVHTEFFMALADHGLLADHGSDLSSFYADCAWKAAFAGVDLTTSSSFSAWTTWYTVKASLTFADATLADYDEDTVFAELAAATGTSNFIIVDAEEGLQFAGSFIVDVEYYFPDIDVATSFVAAAPASLWLSSLGLATAGVSNPFQDSITTTTTTTTTDFSGAFTAAVSVVSVATVLFV